MKVGLGLYYSFLSPQHYNTTCPMVEMHQIYLLLIRRYTFVFFVVSRVCSAEGLIKTVLYETGAGPLGRFVQLVHFRMPGASLGFASYKTLQLFTLALKMRKEEGHFTDAQT